MYTVYEVVIVCIVVYTEAKNTVYLFRRYPVMWQGHLTLKNDSAAVQLHFLSGNVNLAKMSLPQTVEGRTPALRIAQRMRLEQTQLEGVERRMQVGNVETYRMAQNFKGITFMVSRVGLELPHVCSMTIFELD